MHIVEAAHPLLQRRARPQPTILPSSFYSPQGDPPSSEQPLAVRTSSAFPWPLPCFKPSHWGPHPRAACKTHIKAVEVTGNNVLNKAVHSEEVSETSRKGDTAAHWTIQQKPENRKAL